jgi:hypothetical protein
MATMTMTRARTTIDQRDDDNAGGLLSLRDRFDSAGEWTHTDRLSSGARTGTKSWGLGLPYACLSPQLRIEQGRS